MQEKDMANRNLIILWRTGSHLYGTETPQSDVDMVGVAVPDIDYVIGNKRFEQYEERSNKAGSGKRNTSDDTDKVIYSLPKFLHLLVGNNPNIIELLFAPSKCIVSLSNWGKQLIAHPEIFVSKKSYYTFSGYAHSQLRKLTTKNPEGSRLELVEKYGYDCKFAYHLIRLYYEAIELLADGQITFPHIHRRKLVDIKNGQLKVEEVLAEADRLKVLTDEVWAKSTLPQSADINAVNELQKEMILSFWRATSQI